MRETTQRKILEEIIGNAASSSRWKVLIMDEDTTKIVSASVSMFEIMEHKVSLVENLTRGRQPFPEMDAVYFISPTLQCANRVMSDFVSEARAKTLPLRGDGKPVVPVARYGDVHLIFSSQVVGSEIMDLFKSNPLLISRIKTFKEIHLEYLAVESFAFHVDTSNALARLYGRADEALPLTVGRKLASMCISLNEFPNIRYQASSPAARAIADTVNRALTAYKRTNTAFRPNGEEANGERDRGQLLIVDRTFDPLSPLMHEYTYQAMANDLLDISADGTISYTSDTAKGSSEKKAILNSEADELWKEHRHKHIAKVIGSVKERMDDILQTSAGAKLAKKKGGEMDISTMAAAVKNLPEYQQTMSNLNRHVAIASQCMAQFSQQNLMEISGVEQTLSTGVDDDGREVRGRAAKDLVLAQLAKRMLPAVKSRLVAIYVITQRPSPEDKQAVIAAARLSPPDVALLTNLERLMGPLDEAARAPAVAAAATPKAGGGGGGFFSRILGGIRAAEKIAATAEGQYLDTRHVCQLKLLLDQLIAGQLPADRFPSMGPNLPASAEAKSTAQSVRKYKATDRWKEKSTQLSGGRYMAFVAGGISFAEMREAYELMAKDNKEIVVGGTHIINPTQYLDEVANLTSS